MSAILKILSKFDDSGIKKAKSSFGGLKTALGAVGIGFGLKAITDGLLDAAKAASADQKSIQLLNNQLRRNANATEAQVKANDKFIDRLAIQTGIVDDELRPAMGQLVRATGDVSKAQKLLGLALDASAATGRPLNTVTRALSNAFVGNKTQLTRLFPALKESKDLFGDLEKQVGGTAAAQASPFGKLNNALETLQEKLGSIILPYVEQFVTEFIKPGGVGDQIGKFLDDVSNPNTEVGKTFIQVKEAIAGAVGAVREFFAFFGDGDAVKGFGNVAKSLVSMLPALLALKGIMVLAGAGKSIANLAKAVGLLTGAKAAGDGGVIAGGKAGVGRLALAGVASVAITSQMATLAATNMAQGTIDAGLKAKGLTANLATGSFSGGQAMVIPYQAGTKDLREALFGIKRSPQVVVNVQSADPKAVVDAVSKYVKQNGAVPGAWSLSGRP
jgi:hypothetical protein